MSAVVVDPWQSIVGVHWKKKDPDKTYISFFTEVVEALYNPAISADFPQIQVPFETFTASGVPLSDASLTYYGGQFLTGALSWGFHQSDGQGIEFQTDHWLGVELFDSDGKDRGPGDETLLIVASTPTLPAYGTGMGNFFGYSVEYSPIPSRTGGFESDAVWMFGQGALVAGLPGSALTGAYDQEDPFGRGSRHWKDGPPRIMWLAPPVDDAGGDPQPFNDSYPSVVTRRKSKIGSTNYGSNDSSAACILDLSVAGITYDGKSYDVIGYITTAHIDPYRHRLRVLCKKHST